MTGDDAAVRVLVVDDHAVMRAGVAALLDGEPSVRIVGEAADGHEALALIDSLRPDVALVDLRMPGLDGVELTARVTAGATPTRVLVLTTYDGDDDIERAVESGAVGYLLKDTHRAQLVDGIRAASRGETVLAPRVAARLLARARNPEPDPVLTPREVEVLAAAAEGLVNAAIGRRLGIGEATVKTHLLRTFAKLGVGDRTSAVVVAMESGLLPGSGGDRGRDAR
ncbi:response regulator transcription factor [Pseudonocardia parietis]|uniref:DNA-binding NarL/FixJ family response regulator n=1 Tax=Pseudonocardia parietis TaxID=570936 RepID=A0ABS4VRL3_9PSEU|nr:response regulator transcription factor [Pseudonocardia parietis]MBP2366416.1 DNA-binding NarL/FixJ family response regulator [Pseudonocardia parietis]